MPMSSKTPTLKRYKKKFSEVEKEFTELTHDPVRLNEFWEILDVNGNNLVSLAEIDKLVMYTHPRLNNKKALMRAYKQTCLKDGGNGNAWVEPHELPQLLMNLIYFNKLYAAFIDIDRDYDRRLDYNEFKLGVKKLGMKLSKKQIQEEFKLMDANDGGIVLFDEFCVWYTKKVNPEREIATCTSQFVKKRPSRRNTML
jgi:Ca2+-binding EF-hand superfamily protein